MRTLLVLAVRCIARVPWQRSIVSDLLLPATTVMVGRIFIGLLLGFALEVWILIQIWMATSFLFVLFLCALGFVVGSTIARNAGRRVKQDAERAMASGQSASNAMLPRLVEMFAGILLMIPGVITDVLATVLLLPSARRYVADRLVDANWVQNGRFQQFGLGSGFGGFGTEPPRSDPFSTSTSDWNHRGTSSPSPQSQDPESVVIDAEIVDDHGR